MAVNQPAARACPQADAAGAAVEQLSVKEKKEKKEKGPKPQQKPADGACAVLLPARARLGGGGGWAAREGAHALSSSPPSPATRPAAPAGGAKKESKLGLATKKADDFSKW
jgi:hypothetical protein